MSKDQSPGKKKDSRKKAVALRYDKERDASPVAVAKGLGKLAERLIALAEEHGVPIHEDADLVEVLSRLNLNEEIPPSAYVVVAEILAFIYRTNESYKR
ncbi:MAG: EscU/YscU/HrcU family type III secretion system export apparatus switch protein [Desulfobulbaceae bacterium]|nr:EscU/YscU/HrcU family type III secretion system export apparatus switch protein [Desulfobulbaceae bacterium]